MKTLGNLFDYIFSLKSQKNVENTVLFLATFGFIIHLESQIHAIKTLIQCSLDRSNGQSIKSIAKKKYKE